ncbi:hypothetical protein [Pseudomonas sp. SMN11]
MIDHLSPHLLLLLLLIPFALILGGLALNAHLACSHHYNVLTAALQRSTCLSLCKKTWGSRGLISKLLIISGIAGAMSFPRHAVRRGLLNAKDLSEFPAYLKFRMSIASWLLRVGFIWMMANAFIF